MIYNLTILTATVVHAAFFKSFNRIYDGKQLIKRGLPIKKITNLMNAYCYAHFAPT